MLAITGFFYLPGFTQTVEYTIPPGQFNAIQPMAEGLMTAREKSSDRYGFIDANGQWLIPAQYLQAGSFSEGLAWVYLALGKTKSGLRRYGYIDKTGKAVIEEKFTAAKDFSCNRAIVQTDNSNNWACIDRNGKIVFTATNIKADPEVMPDAFADGLLLVQQTDKQGNMRYGYADTTGRLVIPYKYIFAHSFSDDAAVVQERSGNIKEPKDHYDHAKTTSVIDQEGNTLMVVPDSIEELKYFSKGVGVFLTEGENGRGYGAMDKKGNLLIVARFEKVAQQYGGGPFWGQINGETAANKEGYLSLLDSSFKETGKLPLCTADGKCVHESRDHFSEGLLAVKQEELWGYVDQRGQWIISPQFADAWYFTNGFAIVTNKQGQLGVIKNPLK